MAPIDFETAVVAHLPKDENVVIALLQGETCVAIVRCARPVAERLCGDLDSLLRIDAT